MRYIVFLVMLMGLFLVSDVFASKQEMSIEKVEDKENLKETINMVKDVLVKSADRSDVRFIQCLKAFGHLNFCECIKSELPVYQSFDSYFFIITTDKDELNFEQLEGDDKELIINTHKVRDTCVNKAFK